VDQSKNFILISQSPSSDNFFTLSYPQITTPTMRIPYMKILVYILTFVGYCYSGYGSSMLKSLRDAVLSAEIVFGDVFKNFITLSKKFQTVHEIFDTAVDENCIYKCPGSEFLGFGSIFCFFHDF
jgi:hypothetical protein